MKPRNNRRRSKKQFRLCGTAWLNCYYETSTLWEETMWPFGFPLRLGYNKKEKNFEGMGQVLGKDCFNFVPNVL